MAINRLGKIIIQRVRVMLRINIATLNISKVMIDIMSRGDCQQIIPEAIYSKKNNMYKQIGGDLSLRSNKNKIVTRKRDIMVFIPPTRTFNARKEDA